MVRILSLVVILMGVVAVIMGAVFIGLGTTRDLQLKAAMRNEHVTLGIESELGNQVIDSLPEAMKAGDTIREHRHSIAPTYQDLLGEGRFDPTNPQHLLYAQAMNLENYLYLAVVAFGLTQAVMGSGVFMVITGIALGSAGLVFLKLQKTR
ncbi:MAG: hypothetical protein FJ015_06280 [Chloroflexi bacterium]|nr:hypothetical protein [Chloroflexota bacterium]